MYSYEKWIIYNDGALVSDIVQDPVSLLWVFLVNGQAYHQGLRLLSRGLLRGRVSDVRLQSEGSHLCRRGQLQPTA